MSNKFFKTDASKRRYIAQQEATELFRDAPPNLQNEYEIFIHCGDGAIFQDEGSYYPYPLTFKEWLTNETP